MYSIIISHKNLFTAWKEFLDGKKNKPDVLEFMINYEERLFSLCHQLKTKSYSHGGYHAFTVCDPKRRDIHKAGVRDRVLHHAIHRILVPIFEPKFIFDSYSSRKGKGVHNARNRFRVFAWKLSQNNTQTVWVLKCDISKFFDSVQHDTLIELLQEEIKCPETIALLQNIIASYKGGEGKGIPLGNLTSQLFSNIYMDPFDQFMKRSLRVKHFIRYADDFVILSRDRDYIESLIPLIRQFLTSELKLELHPNKIEIIPWHKGVDFLGSVMFPYFRVLRTKTRRRSKRKIAKAIEQYKDKTIEHSDLVSTIHSYTGLLSHIDSYDFQKELIDLIKKEKRT